MTETIRDFADNRVRVQAWSRSTAARVREEFRTAGYLPIQARILGQDGEWQKIHRWCRENIGEQHYSWTGSTFWFETERAAMLFALRWT